MAGIQYEGEQPPTPTEEDIAAQRAWLYLALPGGGLDWAGLPYVCALLDISDPEDLMHRLLVIKLHRPAEQRNP